MARARVRVEVEVGDRDCGKGIARAAYGHWVWAAP